MDLIQQKNNKKKPCTFIGMLQPEMIQDKKTSQPGFLADHLLVQSSRQDNQNPEYLDSPVFLPTAFPANSTSDFRYTYMVEIYHSAPGNFFAQSSLICSRMSWGSSQIYIVQFRHTKLFKRPIFSCLQRRVHRQL